MYNETESPAVTNLDFLNELNDAQRAAVEYTDGPEMVIAGAGSGKTRVLTYKIAYLLEQGMAPWNILALTFTNKAAREMKERIALLVGAARASRLVMGTFHSVFARILRTEAEHIGFNPNFTIYDESDSRSLLRTIIKDLGLDDKVYKPSSVHGRISMAKNSLILPDEYALDASIVRRDTESGTPEICRIYSSYCARCRQANAMDFDDLLTHTYTLLRDNDSIRRKYADRFGYVLVDEYQDTNRAQQRITSLITKETQRICVVGDDAQSIYAFRGANIDNMLYFNKIYPEVKLFKLERNYRSTKRIVQAANSLIKHNERQIRKEVYSLGDEGGKIVFKPSYSDKEEALIVCRDIQRMLSYAKRPSLRVQAYDTACSSYADFAVLYRTNAQSRSFEEAMRKADIPYRIYGGLSFYQRKEIKDVIAYLRVMVNPDDEEALKRIINYPARGIGDTTVAKIAARAAADGVSLWTVISDPARHVLDVNKGTMAKITAFRELLRPYMERVLTANAFEIGRDVIKGCGIYADIHSEKTPEAIARQENLEEFLGGMQDFVESRIEEGHEDEASLSRFLQEVSLMSDLDSDDDKDTPRVSLMTVHSAKGLEFPVVFIVGLEENIFPSRMSVERPRELEEERRLLYVAITRAQRLCVLTCAGNRFRYGRLEFGSPSRFIREIDPRLMTTVTDGATARPGSVAMNTTGTRLRGGEETQTWLRRREPVTPRQRAQTPSAPQGFRPVAQPRHTATDNNAPRAVGGVTAGSIIEHERFGRGEVISVEGTGESTKARVKFVNAGEKQLLLKFARFKVIG